MAKLEGIQVTLPAKVQVSVGETEIFPNFISGVVEGERRGLGLVVDRDVVGKEFDCPGFEVGVFRPLVPVANFSAYLDHTLGLEPGEKFGENLVLRIKNDLRLTFPTLRKFGMDRRFIL